MDGLQCNTVGQQQNCSCAGGSATGKQTCGSDHLFGACDCNSVKRVFATSATFSGNLMTAGGATDGLTGADTLCTQAAKGANLGGSGSWKAWLSVQALDAKRRIADVGPWYLVDGQTKVFNNAAGLTATPLVPITMSEQGMSLIGSSGGSSVWTGTDNGGVTSPVGNCSGWTSTGGTSSLYGRIGDALSTQGWTQSTGGQMLLPCTQNARLYCFEQ